MAIPRHISPDRIARIIITEIRKTPALADCDRATFFGAVLQCAQLGLEPGAALGHAYLLPRRKKGGGQEVQLIIGYQGMIDLVERDGKITIDAHCVYENDVFEISYGTDAKVIHKPALVKPGELIGAYAIGTYTDGRFKARFLSLDEIELAKKSSAAGDFGPWKTSYNEMAMKTAVRRLFKMLPKSPELARVIELEDRAEVGESQNLARELPKEFAEKIGEPIDTTFVEADIEVPADLPDVE